MTLLFPKPQKAAKQSLRQKRGMIDLGHMERVARLPCCICWEHGTAQTDPTEVHHVICGRYSRIKADDTMTISLCRSHHNGGNDPYKIAIHRNKRAWVEAYGHDTDWIPWVHRALETGEFDQ